MREDLAELDAVEGRDWEVVEPPVDFGCNIGMSSKRVLDELGIADAVARQAYFANEHVDVAAWIITFPMFLGSLLLEKPRATLLPDAIGYDFPFGWGESSVVWDVNGFLGSAQQKIGRSLRLSGSVVAHSQHVASRHGIKIFDVEPAKIIINPHPPPDLSRLVPHMKEGRRTEESLSLATATLREYSASRGWSYLEDFPFDDVDYTVVSTQDRPTKNIFRACEAISQLIHRDHFDVKLLTTATIDPQRSASVFASNIDRLGLDLDILSMPDLPRRVHAALYHCAALTIHPSFYEGIVGTLTFFESVSVGTPCLLASGPHVDELLAIEPSLRPWIFDPYDNEALVSLIRQGIARREEVLTTQRDIYWRLATRGWGEAAATYCEAALNPALGV